MCPKKKRLVGVSIYFVPDLCFLLYFSICQIPNFGYGLTNLTFMYVSHPGDFPDTTLELDSEESIRCYLARNKWILFPLILSFPGTSYFIVPSSRNQFSFDLGMLRRRLESRLAKFQERNYSVLECGGKISLIFPCMGYITVKFNLQLKVLQFSYNIVLCSFFNKV